MKFSRTWGDGGDVYYNGNRWIEITEAEGALPTRVAPDELADLIDALESLHQQILETKQET